MVRTTKAPLDRVTFQDIKKLQEETGDFREWGCKEVPFPNPPHLISCYVYRVDLDTVLIKIAAWAETDRVKLLVFRLRLANIQRPSDLSLESAAETCKASVRATYFLWGPGDQRWNTHAAEWPPILILCGLCLPIEVLYWWPYTMAVLQANAFLNNHNKMQDNVRLVFMSLRCIQFVELLP